MEIKNQNNDEIRVADLLSLFAFHKILFFVAFFASIPLAFFILNNLSPKYEAYSVIEFNAGNNGSGLSSFGSGSNMDSIGSLALQSFLPGAAKKNLFIAKFLGTEFLKKAIEDEIIAEKIDDFCKYKKPAWYSVTGILGSLGLRNLNPTPEQAEEIKLQCFKGMIDIEPFSYKGTKTDAYVVSLKADESAFASAALNAIIKQFFKVEKDERLRSHKEKTLYLSEMLSEYDLERKLAKNKLQDLLLKHPLIATSFNTKLGRTNMLPTGVASSNSGLSGYLRPQPLVELDALENQKKEINNNVSMLSVVLEKGTDNISLFEDKINATRGLSKQFLVKVANISSRYESVEKRQKALQLFAKTEIARLEKLMGILEQKYLAKKKEVNETLVVYEDIELLENDFVSKNAVYELLKANIERDTFGLGVNLLSENYVHEQAVPPMFPISPNGPLTILGSALGSIILVVLYLLAVQGRNKKIYTLSQMNDHGLEDTLEFSETKDLNLQKIFQNRVKIKDSNIALASKIERAEGKGLVVEIGSNNRNAGMLAAKVCIFISQILISKNLNVFLEGFSKLQKDLVSKVIINKTQTLSQTSARSPQKGDLLFSGDKVDGELVKRANNNAKEFGICDIEADFFNAVINVGNYDFFILVGKKGKISANLLQLFFDSIGENRKKMVGSVLVH